MVLIKNKNIFVFIFILFIGCNNNAKDVKRESSVKIDTLQGISLLNKPLISSQLDVKRDSLKIRNYIKAFTKFQEDSLQIENIVWLGRRLGYLGDYKKAIKIYSQGLDTFYDSPRLYRHRGHRFISVRQIDNAITDLKKASALIIGKKDIVERDGIPNFQNIPLSTLHNNIWYHLGLAYYLQNNLLKSFEAFTLCLNHSNNDDMQVATRHWLYMILRRLNRNDDALEVLDPVHKNMTIIENYAYFNLLLFYKGEMTLGEIITLYSDGSNEAVQYGIGNWFHYNGNIDKAQRYYSDLLDSGNWASFGYIAAEADLNRFVEE